MKSFSFPSAIACVFLLALSPIALLAQDTNTVITCDGEAQMISTETEATITFRDKVLVIGTDLKMTCDFLQVVVRRKPDAAATLGKAEKFRSMVATGNVVMIQGDREAACGRAEVLPEQDKIILTENPVVVDHEQNTRAAGEKILILNKTRNVIVQKASVVLPPMKDLGYDKNKKPTTPPSAAETK